MPKYVSDFLWAMFAIAMVIVGLMGVVKLGTIWF